MDRHFIYIALYKIFFIQMSRIKQEYYLALLFMQIICKSFIYFRMIFTCIWSRFISWFLWRIFLLLLTIIWYRHNWSFWMGNPFTFYTIRKRTDQYYIKALRFIYSWVPNFNNLRLPSCRQVVEKNGHLLYSYTTCLKPSNGWQFICLCKNNY